MAGNDRAGAIVNAALPQTGETSAPLLHILADYGHDAVTQAGYHGSAGREYKETGCVMEIRSRNAATLRRPRPVVPCAQCGDTLFAPEWSEYLDERHVRHLWSCDHCGYEFETEVSYPRPIAQAA
jgi:ribosomal protein L37AE/L43A